MNMPTKHKHQGLPGERANIGIENVNSYCSTAKSARVQAWGGVASLECHNRHAGVLHSLAGGNGHGIHGSISLCLAPASFLLRTGRSV